jgi:hypothetical protein
MYDWVRYLKALLIVERPCRRRRRTVVLSECCQRLFCLQLILESQHQLQSIILTRTLL